MSSGTISGKTVLDRASSIYFILSTERSHWIMSRKGELWSRWCSKRWLQLPYQKSVRSAGDRWQRRRTGDQAIVVIQMKKEKSMDCPGTHRWLDALQFYSHWYSPSISILLWSRGSGMLTIPFKVLQTLGPIPTVRSPASVSFLLHQSVVEAVVGSESYWILSLLPCPNSSPTSFPTWTVVLVFIKSCKLPLK